MFGSISEWFYKSLLDINVAEVYIPSSSGYSRSSIGSGKHLFETTY
ncbi:MAG TPA: hypothetical protein GXZ56_07805 [Bacteroidales bacterium]|nr:hypothetical protein [Bacteroidales bacterium]